MNAPKVRRRTTAHLPPWIALDLIALRCDGHLDRLHTRVSELHREGWTYGAIGEPLGISRWAARAMDQAAQARTGQHNTPTTQAKDGQS